MCTQSDHSTTLGVDTRSNAFEVSGDGAGTGMIGGIAASLKRNGSLKAWNSALGKYRGASGHA
jgi:hypothetical protein